MKLITQRFFLQKIGALCLGLFALQPSDIYARTFFLDHDRQNSLIAIYDDSNTAVMDQAWDYKGRRIDKDGHTTVSRYTQGYPIRQGYTGHKHLFDADLPLAGDTRLYDPVLGRFYNTDDRTTGGVRGMNRFSYAYNNPLKYNDPDGHAPVDESEENAIEESAEYVTAALFRPPTILFDLGLRGEPYFDVYRGGLVIEQTVGMSGYHFHSFRMLVRFALDTMYQISPNAQIMIDGLANGSNCDANGHTCVIKSAEFTWPFNYPYDPGSSITKADDSRRSFRRSEQGGFLNVAGPGTHSQIVMQRYHGKKSGVFFMVLAHELSHAYRMMRGLSISPWFGPRFKSNIMPMVDSLGKSNFGFMLEEAENIGWLNSPSPCSENQFLADVFACKERRGKSTTGWSPNEQYGLVTRADFMRDLKRHFPQAYVHYTGNPSSHICNIL